MPIHKQAMPSTQRGSLLTAVSWGRDAVVFKTLTPMTLMRLWNYCLERRHRQTILYCGKYGPSKVAFPLDVPQGHWRCCCHWTHLLGRCMMPMASMKALLMMMVLLPQWWCLLTCNHYWLACMLGVAMPSTNKILCVNEAWILWSVQGATLQAPLCHWRWWWCRLLVNCLLLPFRLWLQFDYSPHSPLYTIHQAKLPGPWQWTWRSALTACIAWPCQARHLGEVVFPMPQQSAKDQQRSVIGAPFCGCGSKHPGTTRGLEYQPVFLIYLPNVGILALHNQPFKEG